MTPEQVFISARLGSKPKTLAARVDYELHKMSDDSNGAPNLTITMPLTKLDKMYINLIYGLFPFPLNRITTSLRRVGNGH